MGQHIRTGVRLSSSPPNSKDYRHSVVLFYWKNAYTLIFFVFILDKPFTQVYDKVHNLNTIYWHSMTRKSTALQKYTASRVWWKPAAGGSMENHLWGLQMKWVNCTVWSTLQEMRMIVRYKEPCVFWQGISGGTADKTSVPLVGREFFYFMFILWQSNLSLGGMHHGKHQFRQS